MKEDLVTYPPPTPHTAYPLCIWAVLLLRPHSGPSLLPKGQIKIKTIKGSEMLTFFCQKALYQM